MQVMISSNLEKRIIDVINDHKKQNNDKGMISRRLTTKKLQVEFKMVSSDLAYLGCLFFIIYTPVCSTKLVYHVFH